MADVYSEYLLLSQMMSCKENITVAPGQKYGGTVEKGNFRQEAVIAKLSIERVNFARRAQLK